MIRLRVAVEGGPGDGLGGRVRVCCAGRRPEGFGRDDFCCSGSKLAYMWMPSRKLPRPCEDDGLSVCCSGFGRDGMAAVCGVSVGDGSGGGWTASNSVVGSRVDGACVDDSSVNASPGNS